MAHPEGELATARAAAAAGTLYVVSTLATTRLEDVAAASPGPKWFQLYVHKDRGFTRSLVERAEAAGLPRHRAHGRRAAPRPPPRRRAQPLRPARRASRMANLVEPGARPAPRRRSSRCSPRYVAARHDAVARRGTTSSGCAALTTLPLLVKGIVRADDARARGRARRARASSSPTTARASSTARPRRSTRSPASSPPWPGACPVLVDGGVRRGHRRAQGAGARRRGGARRPARSSGASPWAASRAWLRVLEILRSELVDGDGPRRLRDDRGDIGGDLVRRRAR